MKYTHKRIGGKEFITLCGKSYTIFQDYDVKFFWKDVTCPKCKELR